MMRPRAMKEIFHIFAIHSCHRRTRRGIRGIPGYPVRLKMAGYPSDLNPMVKKMGRKRKRSERERERERARKENEDIQRKKHGIYSRNGKKLMTLASDLVFPMFPSDLVFKGDTSSIFVPVR